MECEVTLLHPSTTKIPSNCEHRFFKLSKTFWIPLYMSNQWLFVTPQTETFTVLCSQETTTIKLQKEGKLYYISAPCCIRSHLLRYIRL
jgi:hypothetical protein